MERDCVICYIFTWLEYEVLIIIIVYLCCILKFHVNEYTNFYLIEHCILLSVLLRICDPKYNPGYVRIENFK